MYIRKNDLIRRLVAITGRDEFSELTVKELSEIYERHVSEGERRYIDVPYKEKDVAKLFGARYDGEVQKWYIPPGVDAKYFDRWIKQD